MSKTYLFTGSLVALGLTAVATLTLLSFPRDTPAQAQQVTPFVFYPPLPPPKKPPNMVKLSTVEQLGKDIIYDTSLSDPPGYACATCHVQETGFTNPLSVVNLGAGTSPGVVPGRATNRRPQSYAYAAFSPVGPYYDATFAQAYVGGDFWDGRVPDLSGQARQPFVDPNEMANIPTNGIYPPPSGGYSLRVVEQVRKAPYARLMKRIFGKDVFTKYTVPQLYEIITQAEAAYESSGEVCPFSSKFDASMFGVPPQTKYILTASELRGMDLYFGNYVRPDGTPVNAHCAECHSSSMFPPVSAMTNGKDTFTMYCFANIGVPKNYGNPYLQMTDCASNPHGCNPMGTAYVDYGLGANPNPAPDGTKFYNSTPGDIPQYRGLFQAPTTRNVDKRPNPGFVKAYMHNGVFKSLSEVVHFYNKRNWAMNPHGATVVFNLVAGPPAGYTPLFAPPEVMDNVNNVQGSRSNTPGIAQVGNLGLTDSEEQDLVNFLTTLSDGYTAPNPVGSD